MKEATFHILESFGVPECRERLPVVLALLEKLQNWKPKTEEEKEEEQRILEQLFDLFEQQQKDAQRISGFEIELDIKELVGILTHNRRLLLNRLRVFKMRSE